MSSRLPPPTPYLETFFAGENQRADFEGWQHFLADAGPKWDLTWDWRANRPNLIQGQGLPWVPGKGNNLTWDAPVSPCLAGAPPITHEMLHCLASSFMDRYQDLLRIPVDDLRLTESATGFLDFGRMGIVTFDLVHHGVPVDRARISFVLNSGNLIQFNMRVVSDIAIDTHPTLEREDAWRAVTLFVQEGGGPQVSRLVPGELVILTYVLDRSADESFLAGQGYGHVLGWRFSFSPAGRAETYRADVDATTGEILELIETTADGMITADVYPTSHPPKATTHHEFQETRPLADAWVYNPLSVYPPMSSKKVTDRAGFYEYDPVGTTIRLDGERVCIDDYCEGHHPAGQEFCGQDVDFTTWLSPGDLHLSSIGAPPPSQDDCDSDGFSTGDTRAARTAFFHVDNMKRLVGGYLDHDYLFSFIDPGVLSFLASPTFVGVNYYNPDPTDPHKWDCNGFASASWMALGASGYRSGSRCPDPVPCGNGGENPGMIAHEFGHMLDANSGNPNSDVKTKEAFADAVAFLQTHNSCIHEGLYPQNCCKLCTACTGGRDMAVFQTPDRMLCACDGSTLLGYGDKYCESLLSSGAYYDMARLMGRELDPLTGWARAETSFLFGMFLTGDPYNVIAKCDSPPAQANGCNSGSWYNTFLAMDDDNGDIFDGTPMACEIWKAFNEHGIACGSQPPPCHDQCPVFSSSVPNATISRSPAGVAIAWTPIPSAGKYVVFRNVLGPYAGYSPLAIMDAPTTTFVDTEAPLGYPYYYAVQALDNEWFCRSRLSKPLGCNYDKDGDGFFRREYLRRIITPVFEDGEPQVSDVYDPDEDHWSPKVLYGRQKAPPGEQVRDALFLFDLETGFDGGKSRHEIAEYYDDTPYPDNPDPQPDGPIYYDYPVRKLTEGTRFSSFGLHDDTMMFSRPAVVGGDPDIYFRRYDPHSPVETAVCVAPGVQIGARTDGHYVAWLDGRGSQSWDVYYSEGPTFSAEHCVTHPHVQVWDVNLYVENGVIVYNGMWMGDIECVCIYDIASDATEVIMGASASTIDGGRVAYVLDHGIWIHDLGDPVDDLVIENPHDLSNPVLFGDLLAYNEKQTTAAMDVHVFDLVTGKDERLTYSNEDAASYRLVGATGRYVVVSRTSELGERDGLFAINLDETVSCNGCGLASCSDCDDANPSQNPAASPAYCSNSYY